MSKKFAAALEGLNSTILLPFSEKVKKKTRSRFMENLQGKMIHRSKTPNGELKILAHKGYYVALAGEHFQTDEPETIHWINTYIKENDVMWDIGANIGLYSMYAAQNSKANVYAFEPFGLNYGVMVEHLFINGLDSQVRPYCIALGEETKLETLNLKGFEAGGALNAVGEAKNQFGSFTPVTKQATLLITPEDFCKIFNAPKPDHIKLDVDSIEVQIVRALKPLLSHIKTITIEIEGENEKNDYEEISSILSEAGLKEISKHQSMGGGRNRLFVRN